MNVPTTSNTTELATLVRNWVHYDTMATNFSKQSTSSRKLRDDFESKIIQSLKNQKMENATIQITGAKLQLVQEKTFPTLTIGRLQQYLHQYYQRKGQMADETDQIMDFIKRQKQSNYETVLCLKKIPNQLVPVPQPPPQLK
jgi:hypothetical protein